MSPWQTIEKDNFPSNILAGISSHPGLQDVLVLKGGVALKKVFLGEYRFPEDLDCARATHQKKKPLKELYGKL
ncbi:MAG: nucleotidyl transferase AbiEii/AbiGii toxin family protein [Deltaproteobacteria bacterium]|nr:nucleotidyl transferase AbiEii/AbiGii toxin family protein [Deltaproteobacteria bacterium]